MNNIMNNKKHVLISIIIMLMLVIVLLLIKTLKKEGFVPKFIKEKYRPLERTVRHHTNNAYSHSMNTISTFAKKMKII